MLVLDGIEKPGHLRLGGGDRPRRRFNHLRVQHLQRAGERINLKGLRGRPIICIVVVINPRQDVNRGCWVENHCAICLVNTDRVKALAFGALYGLVMYARRIRSFAKQFDELAHLFLMALLHAGISQQEIIRKRYGHSSPPGRLAIKLSCHSAAPAARYTIQPCFANRS